MNAAIVPPLEEMVFYNKVLLLIDPQLTRSQFKELVAELGHDYKGIKNWMDWYLNPSRGKHIFPALASFDYSKLAKDTNAQESLGNDFKSTAAKRKLSVVETVHHAHSYLQRIETDFGLASTGFQL